MSGEVSLRDFLDERHRALMGALDEIKEKQDKTNGRIQGAEKAIALLWGAYGIGLIALGWLFVKVAK
jgi:hypothetical protein